MPQKRNPDAAELVRAKTGRILGAFVALLTVVKGLALAYAKDLQEDKEPVFAATDALDLTPYVSGARMLTGSDRGWNLRPITLDGLSGVDVDLRAACLAVQRRTWKGEGSVTWVRLTFPGDKHRLVGRFRAQAAPRRVAI